MRVLKYRKTEVVKTMKNYFGLVPFAKEMDRFFDEDFFPVFPDFNAPRLMKAELMKADIHEKDGMYNIDLELPGYKKEEINVNVVDGNLVIDAKHEENKDEKDSKGNLIRSERSFGSCSRSFYVGDSLKAEDVKAKFEDGVLNITIPANKPKELPEKSKVSIE